MSLLADLVTDWDGAVARGPEAFAREVAAGDRGRPPRRQPVPVGPGVNGGDRYAAGNGNGNGHAIGDRNGGGGVQAPTIAEPVTAGGGPEIPYVSPLRAEAREQARTPPLPSVGPAEPIPTYQEVPDLERLSPDRDIEPALPDEARDRAAGAARAVTPPVDASPDAILHVRFAGGAGTDRVVGAMEAFKGLLAERPGSTRVILHVPAATGAASLPMELRRGVAYDAELLAEVRRRLGEGIVEVSLG